MPLQATTRFELVIRVLQTHALPLGYVATIFLHKPSQLMQRYCWIRGFAYAKPQKSAVAYMPPIFRSPSRARTYNNSVNSRVLYH